MIKFSVLLSVYDKETAEHLDQALESLSKQTVLADEIVLIIDGKIHEELNSVIEKWRLYLPIATFFLPRNVGLGNALNIGLEKSKYDFIARMDSDDICLPDRFEKQISYFESHPDIDLLGGAIAEFEYNPGDINQIRFSCSKHSDIKKYSIKRNPFNHMSMMFKKSVITQAGGYQHHLYMEDYNLWLRCISNGALCHNLNDVLVMARVGSGMLLRRKGIAYIKSELILAKLKLQVFPEAKMKILIVSFSRVLTRLLPIKILTLIYKKLRS